MATIKIDKVRKCFGNVEVLKEFNQVFGDKEFVTLLGPSGCGKTTMLRMLAGFEKPTSGTITIDDRVVSSDKTFVPPEKRDIGMVFQSYAVWPHMTVFDNIAYPLKIKKMPKDEIKKKVDAIMEVVHLSQYADRIPSQLSGGQQQRVAIARALATDPEIIYFDEPTSALDPELTGEVLSVMRKLAEEGMTMLVVTHEMGFARNVSSKTVFMENGVVVEQAPSHEFFAHPREERTREFLRKIEHTA